MPSDLLAQARSVSGFANHPRARQFAQEPLQALARQTFVVDDDDFEHGV